MIAFDSEDSNLKKIVKHKKFLEMFDRTYNDFCRVFNLSSFYSLYYTDYDGAECVPILELTDTPETNKFRFLFNKKYCSGDTRSAYLINHELCHMVQFIHTGLLNHDRYYYEIFLKIVPKSLWYYEYLYIPQSKLLLVR